MFGLYMLAIYLGIAIIAAGFVALLVVVALAVGLVTHPCVLASWRPLCERCFSAV